MAAVALALTLAAAPAAAQTHGSIPADTTVTAEPVAEPVYEPVYTQVSGDSQWHHTFNADTLALEETTLDAGSQRTRRDWSTWTPSPQRALWLALVLPGAGQIYNRKYWKLPLVYGGFMGCIYAMSWNNMMYKDYAQAYLDIMDDDPATESYNKFLHLGRQIDDTNREQYKQVFKKRKDKYRRWRDLSFFVMVGVYALSVIDAYVDAELSVFDISKDLSLKVKPTVIASPVSSNPLYASSLGVNCSVNF